MDKGKFAKLLFKNAVVIGAELDKIFSREGEYARDFSLAEAEAAQIMQPDKYLRPVEFIDNKDKAAENKLIKDLKIHFAKDVPTGDGAAAKDGAYQDPHWGHTTGFFAGKLEIKADNLNKSFKDFRVGLFAKDRTYDVVVRPNFLFDNEPKIAISRMSIKINYPELVHNEYQGNANELDLLLSEGLPLECEDSDGQGFFFRDAKQMLLLLDLAKRKGLGKIAMAAHGGNGTVLKSWKNDTFDEATDDLYEKEQRRRGWAGKHFYSAGPYALSDGAMKFCLKPKQEHQLGELLKVDDPRQGAVRREHNWPEGSGDEVTFTLKVQIATDGAISRPDGEGHPPKSVMAAEYADLEWDDKIAPFEEVGTLTICRKPPEHWKDVAHFANLPISAWNTFHCMRPLGQLFRARQEIHKHHREVRLRKSFRDEDGITSWTCPFSGAKNP